MEYASGVPEAQSAPLSFSEESHIGKKNIYSKIRSIFCQKFEVWGPGPTGVLDSSFLVNGIFRIDSDFLDGRLSVRTNYLHSTYVCRKWAAGIRTAYGVRSTGGKKILRLRKKSWIMS